jgi:hypothetical protein
MMCKLQPLLNDATLLGSFKTVEAGLLAWWFFLGWWWMTDYKSWLDMHQTGSVDHFATSSLKTSEELKETTTKDNR